MSGTIVNSLVTSVLNLTSAQADPLSVTSAGIIETALLDGVYGVSGIAWTIGNAGSIIATLGNGIRLGGARQISNSGLISGLLDSGIDLAAGGGVANLGSIGGGADGVLVSGAAGRISNFGVINGVGIDGALFNQGGSVLNGSAGSTLGLIIGHVDGVAMINGGELVTNYATITGSNADGVYLESGGSVSNIGSLALVTGQVEGILVTGGAGSVSNQGILAGAVNDGVHLAVGGSVGNSASGLISGGQNGVIIALAAGTVSNDGQITGSSFDGVNFGAGGSIGNQGTISGGQAGVFASVAPLSISNSGLISGSIGIDLGAVSAASVLDSGRVIGTGGTAIAFGGGVNQLTLLPGAVLGNGASGAGIVTGAVADNLLSLGSAASGSATSVGTLSGFGSDIQSFATITIDAGAEWLIEGALSGLAGSVVIAGLATGDRLDLTDFAYSASDQVSLTGINDLVLTNSLSQSATIHLAAGDLFGPHQFSLSSDGAAGTVIDLVPCFLAGTRIRTKRGEKPVERLKIGDMVATMKGDYRPIIWIGRRSYDPSLAASHPALWPDIRPVRIRQNALADHVPARDLLVSPLHALAIGGALIPAGCLVNQLSIDQPVPTDMIDYYHIELERHDILFAEGAAAETYLDCGNRHMFDNHLDAPARAPVSGFCAPRLEEGAFVEAVNAGLRARADVLFGAMIGGPMTGPMTGPVFGPVVGRVDEADHGLVRGWALAPEHQDEKLWLDIYDGTTHLARVIANHDRPDLRLAGFDNGHHGFRHDLAVPLAADQRHCLHVRFARDQSELAGSPVVIEPVETFARGPALIRRVA
jgi:hypothetical protein